MKRVLVMCSILVSLDSYCQLLTYETSAQALISSSFLGQAYEVFNVEYTGYSLAKGQFNATATNLGLTEGVVLTTGTILDSVSFGNHNGPFAPNNNSSAGLDNNMMGNAMLTSIANSDTYNASVLEFDFIPSVDFISLKYVFGSDEYPEFVGAGFNDVFAFFIFGPGFGGIFNMATVPGTSNMPVTIDNVNDTTNSAFYVNNGDGNQSPQNGSDFYIQYDGFTTGLVASSDLLIGETYHLVIAIADVADGAYDSGLFIEKCGTCVYHVSLDKKDVIQMSIYPNPSQGFVYVDFVNSFKGELTVYDVVGNIIRTISIQSKHTAIDVHNLNNGVYYFTFSDGNNIQFEKVVID